MRIARAALFCLVLAAVVPARAERAADFFPVPADGRATWEYVLDGGAGGRVAHVLQPEHPVAQARRGFVVAWGFVARGANTHIATEVYKVGPDGVGLVSYASVRGERFIDVFEPPLLVLKDGFKVGSRWTWKGRIGLAPLETAYEVEAQETIEVHAGKFDCFRVVERDTGQDRTLRRWYAKGVGLVKEESVGREGRSGKALLRHAPGEKTAIADAQPDIVGDLVKARAGFEARFRETDIPRDEPAPRPPAGVFEIVRYDSPAGKLVAYLTPAPGDGKKRPAVVWCHGGFGGIGEWLFDAENPQAPKAFRDAGFVLMCPAWRGENDNPGRCELFYGEVDDAIAAVGYLKRLPHVDAARIYVAGHSTGGTIALLVAESEKAADVRAVFSFGGAPDLEGVVDKGTIYGYRPPFDVRSPRELRLRSPIQFAAGTRVPTFYFEGEDSGYCADAKKMESLARAAGAPLEAHIVAGGDHFDILPPLTALVAKKIATDKGPRCSILVSAAEVKTAFETAKRKK